MIGALVLQTVRSILASWPRMTLALAAILVPLAEQVLSGSEAGDPQVDLAALILLAGACRSDIQGGLLRAILGRPVTRAQYLLGRWAGGVVILWGWALTFMAGALAITPLIGDGMPGAADLALGMLAVLAPCALLAAWFVAASAVLPTLFDVIVPLVLIMTIQAVKEFLPAGGLLDALAALPLSILVPSLEGGPAAFVVRAAGSAALLLGLGLLAFNRRRIPAEARS
jgi:hypothetical protein